MNQPKADNSADRCRRGYVMLAVLVCLLLAGLAMTRLAESSLRLSATALERQRNLQRQWGLVSCQRTLLPAASRLFTELQASDRPAPAPATLSATISLGEFQFDLLLADENAKLNINTVYHHRGRAGAEQMVNRNLGPRTRPPVRLSPEVDQGKPLDALRAGEALPVALQSWGQVFDFSLATDSQHKRWMIPHWTAKMTLWGRGQLNVRRASNAAIVETCQLVVSEASARQLQKACRENPKHQVDVLIKQLDIDAEQQRLLKGMLTEYSSSFSLWITARRTRVESQRFSVLQVDEEGITRTTDFIY